MLRNLYISNFVLIEELNLDFTDGFSVFTGETGAGKSIFIDAINILIGGRFNTSMIRKDSDRTIIEGTFDADEEISVRLRELGLDDDALIITREFYSNGRTVNRINRRSVTAAVIRDMLADKIDIHCQRDSQYLLNSRYHMALLDSYCQDNDLLNETGEKYREYNRLQKEYEVLLNNEFNGAQLEVIEYQLNELNKLKLKAGEDEEIEQQLKLYQAKEKIRSLVENTRDMFTADDGILTKLYDFTRQQDSFSDFERISENVSNIVNAYYAINDDYDSIISYFDNDDISVEDIDALNSRLYDLQRAKRKYSLDLNGLISMKKELENKLDSYSNREAILKDLLKKCENAHDEYLKTAHKLSQKRQQASTTLEKQVVDQLKDLNLENAVFKVGFSEGKETAKGNDDIEFMISMNKGQPLRPLAQVASGGEMSRLMLGLKTVFSSLQGTRLIIFDEIDTGVSGYVAFNMGVKMKEISHRAQVFAVTHLAAVASLADYHFRIEKTQNDTTTTDVVELDNEGRIRELAILSSASVSDVSLAAARELLQKASMVK